MESEPEVQVIKVFGAAFFKKLQKIRPPFEKGGLIF